MKKNLYLVLGVSPRASGRRIKRAYRDLVKRHHPDKGAAADPERFRDIQQAYETLGDAERREAYDRDERHRRHGLGPRPHTGAVVPLRPFRHPQRGSTFVTGRQAEALLRPLAGERYPKGSFDTVAIEMVLTPEEALHGGRFTLSVPVAAPCRFCGRIGWPPSLFCDHCRGSGRATVERRFALVLPPEIQDGSSAALPLDEVGLAGTVLHLLIRVSLRP